MGAIIVLVVLFATIAGYFKWIHTYWRRRGISGPEGLPFIGNYYDLADVNKPRGYLIHKWTQKFGKVFGYYEGAVPVLVVSDMDMLQELFLKKFDNFYARKSTNHIHGNLECSKSEPRINLFTSRGARWKRLRALASPGFSVKALKQVHDVMEDSAINMVDLMAKHEDGKPFNIHAYFQEFTYDVISRLAMGQPNSELFNNSGVEIVKSIFMRTHRVLPWYFTVLFPQFEHLVKRMFYNHAAVQGGDIEKLLLICKKTVESRIQEREENAKLGFENAENDFIDMFLNYYSEQVEDIEFGSTVEKKVTAEDVIGACFVFLLAGFDTTANSLAYASYLLAKHPEKMKLAQEEVDTVVGSENVSYDDMTKLKYLDAVVRESLRLYPVAWFACSRECVKPTTLGDIYIDKGVKIEADVMSLHRSKEIWGENADDFVPERWLEPSSRHTMSWIPFGAGPRQCVGMRLGLSEAKTALAHLLRRYDLVAGVETEKELNILGCTTTSPEAVTLYLKPRI
ncbi:Putative cytochrome P450 cyp-13B1 [Caenorhabditis elegans]|uniref:Putative cytochrome P450 cyp-13B1 n=1 Tax=Caenorhabditis elegans TaxID=6239 RepID=C13B1_CAEEL|nr:Putative cytochrome P450 cyp-13B1 [Caenorhabditis elegans]O17624.3 RecName: Full=Putative cytochrome P450 cyp-13B1 [Caenorhabditis elegans]CAB54208.1 Putative cytochrome P450 cyp-13B1 [Caenorhabditis elegans]|eukprot:NP_510233.1 Putative cytochrome P450 cyp-13B1 [Caenorhabditis elegans]